MSVVACFHVRNTTLHVTLLATLPYKPTLLTGNAGLVGQKGERGDDRTPGVPGPKGSTGPQGPQGMLYDEYISCESQEGDTQANKVVSLSL